MAGEVGEYGIRIAIELQDLAEGMYRQRLRNDDPGITEADIDRVIAAWYADRPGAVHGDMVGVPSKRPM